MMNNCLDCDVKLKSGRAVRCNSCAAKYRWNIGRYDSESFRTKQSKTTKAAHARGAYSSEEYRKKLSESARRQWSDPVMGDRIYFAIKRGQSSDEYRKKLSTSQSKRFENPEARKIMSLAMKKRYEDPKAREETSKAMKLAYKRDPTIREKQSKAAKAQWARGDGPFNTPCSNLEIDVCGVLEDHDIVCVPQYKPDGIGWTFDIYLPDYQTFVEVDGEFWHHSDWARDRGSVEHDAKRDQWAVDNGYDIIRVREKHLKDVGIEELVEQHLIPALRLNM